MKGVKRQKLLIILALALAFTIAATPLALADVNVNSDNGNAHTIKVWPIGTKTDTGTPIVTSTPANLFILHTGSECIENVWLLIVIDEPTYMHLDQIAINGTKFLGKTDFTLVTTKDIPPTSPNHMTGYPGVTWQYTVSAVKSNMGLNNKDKIYYAVKYFLPKISTKPTDFVFTVTLTSPSSIKALVLGMGKADTNEYLPFYGIDCFNDQLDRFTSFSKGTLVTPEIAPLALMASPFAAFGLIKIKRRKK